MTLLYFSPVRRDSYFQRPHYFVEHFLRVPGRAVLWVDPYPTRLPTLRDFSRPRPASLVAPRPANLDVLSVRALPFEPLAAGRWINRQLLMRPWLQQVGARLAGTTVGLAVGRPSALALAAMESLPHAWSAYDAMDDFPQFYHGRSRRSAAELEQAIADRATVVLTSSAGLWRKFAACGDKRLLVRNAFDIASLPPAPRVRDGRPIFGYVGCVGDWFDWRTVIALAEGMPDATVEIVGPRVDEPPHLPANVTLLPACPHDRAIDYLQRFSVGLIPFLLTQLTAGVDPIKYYGYRAMGLPVLSTRFGEMADRGDEPGTHFLDDRSGIAAVAQAALADPAALATVGDFRAANDWRHRFEAAGLFSRVLPAGT